MFYSFVSLLVQVASPPPPLPTHQSVWQARWCWHASTGIKGTICSSGSSEATPALHQITADDCARSSPEPPWPQQQLLQLRSSPILC